MLNAGAAAVLPAELTERRGLAPLGSGLFAGASLSSLPMQGMCWSLNSCAFLSQQGNLSLEVLHLSPG